MQASDEPEVLLDGQVSEDRSPFVQVHEATTNDVRWVLPHHRHPVDHDLARRWLEETRDRSRHRALPRTIGTQDGEDAAGSDRELYTEEGAVGAVGLVQVGDLEHWRGHAFDPRYASTTEGSAITAS